MMISLILTNLKIKLSIHIEEVGNARNENTR